MSYDPLAPSPVLNPAKQERQTCLTSSPLLLGGCLSPAGCLGLPEQLSQRPYLISTPWRCHPCQSWIKTKHKPWLIPIRPTRTSSSRSPGGRRLKNFQKAQAWTSTRRFQAQLHMASVRFALPLPLRCSTCLQAPPFPGWLILSPERP